MTHDGVKQFSYSHHLVVIYYNLLVNVDHQYSSLSIPGRAVPCKVAVGFYIEWSH